MANLAQLHSRLCAHSLFAANPLYINDSLEPLLTRYCSDEQERETATAVNSNDTLQSLAVRQHWRALADMLASQILAKRNQKTVTIESVQAILELWTTRLVCLHRLRLHTMLSSESGAIFAVLPRFYLRQATPSAALEPYFERLVPFDLILFRALLPAYLIGDRQATLAQLSELLKGCRWEYRRTKDKSWRSRLHKVSLAMASVLTELQEYETATHLLKALVAQVPSSANIMPLVLLSLQSGNIRMAEDALQLLRKYYHAQEAELMEVLLFIAKGDWVTAEHAARKITETSPSGTALNMHASTTLYTGNIASGLDSIQKVRSNSPLYFFNSETCIINLITLQELQSGNPVNMKVALLGEAAKYSRESLDIECFRL